MMAKASIIAIDYQNAAATTAHAYLLPALDQQIAKHRACFGQRPKAFDLGCGNGSVAAHVAGLGFKVVGVDPSASGIEQARANFKGIEFSIGFADIALAKKHGKFDLVYSLEVIEHVYDPRSYAATVASLLKEDGVAIISTPYHGYMKNLAISLCDGWDKHFTVLWDGGHIKFWSFKTLCALFAEQGLTPIEMARVGRVSALAKSMLVSFKKRS
jgi:2-polyprenyl-6-hydroxyphenyl methylase/3-demethylubiquinone-9 3-methyltransferase